MLARTMCCAPQVVLPHGQVFCTPQVVLPRACMREGRCGTGAVRIRGGVNPTETRDALKGAARSRGCGGLGGATPTRMTQHHRPLELPIRRPQDLLICCPQDRPICPSQGCRLQYCRPQDPRD